MESLSVTGNIALQEVSLDVDTSIENSLIDSPGSQFSRFSKIAEGVATYPPKAHTGFVDRHQVDIGDKVDGGTCTGHECTIT